MPNKNKFKPLSTDEKIKLVAEVDALRHKGISVVNAMKRLGQKRSEQCYYNFKKTLAKQATHSVGKANGRREETPLSLLVGPRRFERVFDAQGIPFLLVRNADRVEFFPAQQILDVLGATE